VRAKCDIYVFIKSIDFIGDANSDRYFKKTDKHLIWGDIFEMAGTTENDVKHVVADLNHRPMCNIG
jgi:hypothetical protein